MDTVQMKSKQKGNDYLDLPTSEFATSVKEIISKLL